jgi:hypothetical protein
MDADNFLSDWCIAFSITSPLFIHNIEIGRERQKNIPRESSMDILKISFLFILCALVSCKDKSTNIDQRIPFFSYETSKCVSSGLAKRSKIMSDSIFSYSFSQNLIFDFSVKGNCCPDSNRFIISHDTRSDTIVITVIDTAQNLCRCSCLYMVHVELDNLSLDSYIIRCRLGNGQTFIDPIHLVTVARNK